MTCGGGTRTKTRTKIVEEKHGGQCVGVAKMDEECNAEECPRKEMRI